MLSDTTIFKHVAVKDFSIDCVCSWLLKLSDDTKILLEKSDARGCGSVTPSIQVNMSLPNRSPTLSSSPLQHATSRSTSRNRSKNGLDLSDLPPMFLLPTHLPVDEFHAIKDKLVNARALVTDDIQEAFIVLGRIERKKRASLELRARNVWMQELSAEAVEEGPLIKRPRLDRGASEGKNDTREHEIDVVKLRWLEDSIQTGHALPFRDYVIFRTQQIASPSLPRPSLDDANLTQSPHATSPESDASRPHSVGILERARADTVKPPVPTSSGNDMFKRSEKPAVKAQRGTVASRQRPALVHMTSSEEEAAKSIPPAPDWVKYHVVYSCQRSTYVHPPNEAFIEQLCRIRQIRKYTLDEIGVRAYSTSIAAVAAYPYTLRSAKEVLTLPGCESRIANLFTEWRHSTDGTIEDAKQLDTDPTLHALAEFNNIWGVGPAKARDFYYHQGWRDLDDIIEHGWNSLTRVQQVGLKYFEELHHPIPREETKKIADTILLHAQRARPNAEKEHGSGIECIIVGGYRRGREWSDDVDVILTHRDERVTHHLVRDVVDELEKTGYITHTLSLTLSNSGRDQQTLPYTAAHREGGFDTLDKALVLWQELNHDTHAGNQYSAPSQLNSGLETSIEGSPAAPETETDEPRSQPKNTATKKHMPSSQVQQTPPYPSPNPNPHRRVDIIVSPWRTIGCAVVGWTGDKTFQRDLRRYAHKVRNWKFDSSGIRVRAEGDVGSGDGGAGFVIELEAGGETWQERERQVMEGLGIGWRPPDERCTL